MQRMTLQERERGRASARITSVSDGELLTHWSPGHHGNREKRDKIVATHKVVAALVRFQAMIVGCTHREVTGR